MSDHISIIEGTNENGKGYTEITVDEGVDDGFFFTVAHWPSKDGLYEVGTIPTMFAWISPDEARNLATALNDHLARTR